MSFKSGLRGYALGALAALAMLLAASTSHADTAVSACGTLPTRGNYFLTKNLTSAGTCIVVGDEGVSFDMRGHTITGNGTGDGITDGGSHFESMAIANGKIRNFSNGIGLDKSCCVVIRNVDSSKNTATGILVGECCGTIDSVTANNNGSDGIDAFDCCFTLNNIQANHNGGGGVISKSIIQFHTACCTSLSNSSVSGNTGVGVDMENGFNYLVSSTVQKNGADGADLSGSCCNYIVDSTVTGNTGDGMHLTGNHNLVTSSKANQNTGVGIFLRTTENQITSSQATGNGGAGADVGCPGAITGLNAKGNTGTSLTTSGGVCTKLNNTL